MVREGTEEWKAARLNSGWKATLQRFEEMVSVHGWEAFCLFLFVLVRACLRT